MDQMMVERSIWIEAPRERVWQAVSEPAQMAQWFLPPVLGAEMKRNGDGKLLVSMGPMEIPVAVLEDSRPQQQLTTRSLPDGLITNTYILEDENGGTRVTVRMGGFERLSPDARQDRLGPSGESWEKALLNLKAYIAGAELPYPEGYVAALFGYRREAKKRYAVERSIWIRAPRERVWAALTDLKLVEQWFSPGTRWEVTAPEVGGRLFVPDPETGAQLYVNVIELLDPPHRLVLRSEATPPDVPHVTAYTLEEENGGTRLTLTDSGYELEPEDQRWGKMEQNAFGFGMMLDNLKAVAEGESVPYAMGF